MIGNTAHVDNSETPVGFDVSLVEPWLAAHTRVVPPCRWTRLTGGHSNLTYLLTDSNGAEFVIRRPPQGDLLPKAHDMFREYRIIEALHPVGIPVAEPVGYCDDRAVCDRHFYVMAKVGGSALYNGTDTAQHLDLAARGRVGESFMSVLASIHSVDPADVGSANLVDRTDTSVANSAPGMDRGRHRLKPLIMTTLACTSCTSGCSTRCLNKARAASCTATMAYTTRW